MEKKVDNTGETLNVDALFMGPKSENHKYFKETLNFLIGLNPPPFPVLW